MSIVQKIEYTCDACKRRQGRIGSFIKSFLNKNLHRVDSPFKQIEMLNFGTYDLCGSCYEKWNKLRRRLAKIEYDAMFKAKDTPEIANNE